MGGAGGLAAEARVAESGDGLRAGGRAGPELRRGLGLPQGTWRVYCGTVHAARLLSLNRLVRQSLDFWGGGNCMQPKDLGRGKWRAVTSTDTALQHACVTMGLAPSLACARLQVVKERYLRDDIWCVCLWLCMCWPWLGWQVPGTGGGQAGGQAWPGGAWRGQAGAGGC